MPPAPTTRSLTAAFNVQALLFLLLFVFLTVVVVAPVRRRLRALRDRQPADPAQLAEPRRLAAPLAAALRHHDLPVLPRARRARRAAEGALGDRRRSAPRASGLPRSSGRSGSGWDEPSPRTSRSAATDATFLRNAGSRAPRNSHSFHRPTWFLVKRRSWRFLMADANDRLTAEDKEHLGKLEEALFEIRRVIAGQEGMLERLLALPARRRPPADRGRPGPREDAGDQDDGLRARRLVLAHPVHAGPRPERPRRHPDLPPRQARVRDRARPGLLQLPARRRDQPRARQGAVGAARGDAGAAGDDRPHDASGARPVPRPRDAEPDRVRGHVPAARGAGRPLHAQGARRLPAARRGADRRRALARAGAEAPAGARRSTSSATCRRSSSKVFVDPALVSWVVDLATATRKPAEAGLDAIAPYISYGASPRGPISVIAAARALAVLRQRDYVLPSDVEAVVRDGFRHRLVLSYQALAEEVTAGPGARPRARGDRTAADRPRTHGAGSAPGGVGLTEGLGRGA